MISKVLVQTHLITKKVFIIEFQLKNHRSIQHQQIIKNAVVNWVYNVQIADPSEYRLVLTYKMSQLNI
jgi:hypothetical protein